MEAILGGNIPKRLGITGGIGAGKTLVTKLFAVYGWPVYYADDAARRLMNDAPELKAAITARFGQSAYPSELNGQLDRAYLGKVVFGNAAALADLNDLVHPATINDFRAWCGRQTAPWVVKEAALLYESGTSVDCDVIAVVTAPDVLRIARVVARSGLTEAEIRQRMARQNPQESNVARADFVVVNDEATPLIFQISEILHNLTWNKKAENGGIGL